MKIIFKNGSELPYHEAREFPEFYENAQRRVLEIDFLEKEVSYSKLKEIINVEDNLSDIDTVGDPINGISMKHDWINYELKISLIEHEKVIINKETNLPETVEMLTLKLARLTNIELQLKKLGINYKEV